MDSEPGLVRVIRAFLDERDDVDPESNVVSRVSDLKGIRSTLTWGSWVFSALRDTKRRTVLVPEGLHDPDERGMREMVWAEAKALEMSVKMDNPSLLRIATTRPREVVPDPKDINSRRTRVLPVLGWLRDHGEPGWPDALVAIATGLAHAPKVGPASLVTGIAHREPGVGQIGGGVTLPPMQAFEAAVRSLDATLAAPV